LRIIDASTLCGVLVGQAGALAAVNTSSVDPADPFHCPALVEAETLNALRGLERGRKLTQRAAGQAVADLAEARMILYPFSALRPRVWALRHNLNVYDASYLALAELLDDSVLLTGDAGLAEVAGASLGDARVQLIR
jgi:predicted nucleic acid-binding protein